MMSLIRRWSFPAAIVTAALALTACGGSSGSPVSMTPNQIPLAGSSDFGTQLHASTLSEVAQAASCPTSKFLQCFTVSLKSGLVVDWCDGTKKSPCADTKKFMWSGDVCLTKAKTCNPIKQMTAAWTGPFKCKASIKVCNGGTKGDYEVDTISIGKTPPKKTSKYIYKQAIDLNSSLAAYIGLNVGP
ncbi:MAG TPA: hypothetical protein VGI19_14315 [Candidatus Cybelea sp.]|jgi:hypothetical protein